MPYLERDGEGRHLSTLRVDRVQLSDSGEYSCQPAVGPAASVLVNVLNRDTEVQAVLGEGECYYYFIETTIFSISTSTTILLFLLL